MKELKNNKNRNGWFKTGHILLDVYAKNLGPFPLLTYFFIKSYEYKKTRYSWPSEEFIAEKLNISTRTVKRSIKILESYHLITTEKIKLKGKWPSNLYYLTYSKFWLLALCDSQSHSYRYPQGDRKCKTCVTDSHYKKNNDKNTVLGIIKNHKIQTKNESP